jgi:large subunit ribosomal protein L32e
MPRLKFLRRNWSKASRLGRKRKNKQVWRSPKGRHSKTRGERKGYPAIVKIGYKQDTSTSGLIENKTPVLVNNIKELLKLGKNEIAILGNIGMKKKLEIAKFAKEKKIEISNLNIEKLLKKAEKIKKFKSEQKKAILTKKETKAEEKKEKAEEKRQKAEPLANSSESQIKETREEKKSEEKK